MLRKVRIIVQSFCFVLFFLHIFVALTYPLGYVIPHAVVYGTNPLVGIATAIASRALDPLLLWMAAAMLIATAFMGRFFCGLFCPLGALIDFSDKYLFGAFRQSKKNSYSKSLHTVKYGLLILVLGLAAFGVLFPLFFDPLSLLTRLATLTIHPVASQIKSDAANFYSIILNFLGIEAPFPQIRLPQYFGTLGAGILFLFILGAGMFRKRFWCQNICPSGALFGLVGQRAIFRRTTIDGTCNSCASCARICPTNAIDPQQPTKTDIAECILCGNCTAIRNKCERFTFGMKSAPEPLPPNLSRRHVVAGIAGAIFAFPLFRSFSLIKGNTLGTVIRPPGAVPEKEFLSLCIACGACMKVCPSNTIQPCTLEDGFGRINTPKISPRRGACEEKCYICGHVCPTGALRSLPYEEKSFAKIGTAVIDRNRCLTWAQNRECLVCDETCPYNAIIASVQQTTKGPFKVPVVYEDLCVGCGMCEYHCPIADKAAIQIFSFGENRRSNGPYLTDWQRKLIVDKRNASDSHVLDKNFGSVGDTTMNQTKTLKAASEQSQQTSGGLPPGFSE